MIWNFKGPSVKISIYQGVLDAIFDECDRYDADETGGRIVGIYQSKGKKLEIEVSGMIEPGPDARRTSTSFFQDGDYQEKVFRTIEEECPEIEHLGNWHTHHVNGLATLSSGDIATYHRIVNHEKHNTDFLYAVLVVAKTTGPKDRYVVKHYLLRRGDPSVHEVPHSQINIINRQPIWPHSQAGSAATIKQHDSAFKITINQERARDKEMFSEMYPNLKPYFSKSVGVIYWKGILNLIDGTVIDLIVMEYEEKGKLSYSINIVGSGASSYETSKLYADRTFKSARMAVWLFERDLNREIFLKTSGR